MDFKDPNTVSDTTAVEKEDKPEYLPVVCHENKAELDVLCQGYDGSKISVDGDADNSESKQEVISSASSPSFANTSEGNSNLFQSNTAEASVGSSSAHACAGNMREGAEVRDKDSACCSQADTIKDIRGSLDRLPLEITMGDIMPSFSTVGNDKKTLVILPSSTIKSVSSLKELSANAIPTSTLCHDFETGNISDSEISNSDSCASRNRHKYVSNKDKEQNPGSSKSSELQPGLSDVPPTEGEDSIVVHAGQREVEESGDDNERKAFFYISSSCSVPGMNDGSEWQSVSAGYKMPSGRTDRRFVRQESREPVSCLGTKRCHYIVIAIALLTTVIGCVVYHLSHSGIVPDEFRSVGSTTAFVSFAVCVFSSIYIGYLNNYLLMMPVIPNYEMLGDVDSVMAMIRASNPEFVYTDHGYHVAQDFEFTRQTQSADILDRRGYCRKQTGSQTEVKRFTEESGTDYSSQPQKRFKPGYVVPEEIIQLSDLGFVNTSCSDETFQSNSGKEVTDKDGTDNMREDCHTSSEKPTDSKISNIPNESDTNLYSG